MSMQRMNKKSRMIAFGSTSYDIDMKNACFSILGQEFTKNGVQEEFPILCKIVEFPDSWQQFISNCYDEDVKSTKNRLIRIFFDLYQATTIHICGVYY